MTDTRMKCRKGHTGLIVNMVDKEEGWIEVVCPTCLDTVFYNGA
jgi:hypothetical protein